MSQLKYRKLHSYKYQLLEDYSCDIGLCNYNLHSQDEWVQLRYNGKLVFKKGYAWDGPSGPTIDTKTFLRASLLHDGLYQLMRENKLSLCHRQYADMVLRFFCLEDGMCEFRAWYVYWIVRIFGKKYAKP